MRIADLEILQEMVGKKWQVYRNSYVNLLTHRFNFDNYEFYPLEKGLVGNKFKTFSAAYKFAKENNEQG